MSKFYPEAILTHLPPGSRALLKEVADRHRIKVADLVREVLCQLIEREGLRVPGSLEERRATLPARAE